MPLKLIKGSFHVRNYSPDGDSIRFQPDDVGLVHDLAGSRPKFNARNHVQLRIEAIDTLETHYTPPSGGGTLHQPLELAQTAADKLMEFVGIENVEWDSEQTEGKYIKTVLSCRLSYSGSRITKVHYKPLAVVDLPLLLYFIYLRTAIVSNPGRDLRQVSFTRARLLPILTQLSDELHSDQLG
jgi:hypothetical protein